MKIKHHYDLQTKLTPRINKITCWISRYLL